MLPSSKEGILAFDQVLMDSCLLVRPPEKLSVADWADKFAFLSPEGSAQPGKVYVSNAEYQREPLRCLSDVCFQTVVLDWPSQVGKTQIGLWFTGYHIAHDPCPILFMEPDENLAKTVAKDRIDPMIRDTPVLKKLFRDARSRNSGNDMLHKSFPGGHLTLAWASSSSQTASRPIRVLITDEESRPGYDQNKEGDAIGQARARLATFPSNRKHLRISSPALARTCKITKAFQNSDQRRYYVPCPQCEHMQTLRWEQMHWPPGEPNECYYVCEANGCEIQHSDKYTMIRNGKWIAENPGGGDGRTAGFHINALYSTIGYSWAELVSEFLECAGIPDKVQVFQNTKLALPWDEEAEGVDLGAVQRHAEEYAAQAPAWVLMVTSGADVQKDRIEATKWGYGLDDVSGVIEHRVFMGDPLKTDVWIRFEEWRREPVEHETGLMIPVVCTFVDSGDGNRTQAVYEYTRRLEKRQVFACKGSSLNGAPLINRGNRVGKYRTIVISVGVSTAKDTIYGRLQIDDKSRPGYIHFPSNPDAGCDDAFFQHLTAERLVTRQTKGGEISRWENTATNRRNEALDTAVYAMAAKEFSRPNMKQLDAKLRAKVERLKPTPPADRRAQRAATGSVPSLPSPASSPASPSPQAPKLPQRSKKRRRIPGFSWIQG